MHKSTVLAFIAGVGTGVAATYFFFKRQSEETIQKEVDSLREYYAKKEEPGSESKAYSDEEDAKEKANRAKEKPDLMKYAANLAKMGYTDYSTGGGADTTEKKEEKKAPDDLEIIPPDEFGEDESYNKISLTYYADEVLCEGLDIIEDIDSIVGPDALDSFGEWEDDSVFVRNDRMKCYFEILKSLDRYADAIKEKPYKAGVE